MSRACSAEVHLAEEMIRLFLCRETPLNERLGNDNRWPNWRRKHSFKADAIAQNLIVQMHSFDVLARRRVILSKKRRAFIVELQPQGNTAAIRESYFEYA
jgi:hypothetical protein